MALPRNIRIEQDPLTQALNTLENLSSNIIQGISTARYQGRRELDARTVDTMAKLAGEADDAGVERTQAIIGAVRALPGSKMIGALRDNTLAFLNEELSRKQEFNTVLESTQLTIDELSKELKSADDGGGVKDAFDTISLIENNFARTDQNLKGENEMAFRQMTEALVELKTRAMVKAGVYGYDDPNIEGFQFADDSPLGEHAQAKIVNALKQLETDPLGALKTLRTIDTGVQADIRYKEILRSQAITDKKARETIERSTEKLTKAAERREEEKIKRDKIGQFKTDLADLNATIAQTGISPKEVRPIVANISITTTYTKENAEAIEDNVMETLFSLVDKMSDLDVPKDGRVLLAAVKDARKNDPDNVRLPMKALADWWVSNSKQVKELDVEKFGEWFNVSSNEETNRLSAVIKAIHLYADIDDGLFGDRPSRSERKKASGAKEPEEKPVVSKMSQVETDVLGKVRIN